MNQASITASGNKASVTLTVPPSLRWALVSPYTLFTNTMACRISRAIAALGAYGCVSSPRASGDHAIDPTPKYALILGDKIHSFACRRIKQSAREARPVFHGLSATRTIDLCPIPSISVYFGHNTHKINAYVLLHLPTLKQSGCPDSKESTQTIVVISDFGDLANG